MKRLMIAGLFGLQALLSLQAGAAATQPLLMPGKQALYQRVLAVPGGELHEVRFRDDPDQHSIAVHHR